MHSSVNMPSFCGRLKGPHLESFHANHNGLQIQNDKVNSQCHFCNNYCQTTHSVLALEWRPVWSAPALAEEDGAWLIHFLQVHSNSRWSPAHKHNLIIHGKFKQQNKSFRVILLAFHARISVSSFQIRNLISNHFAKLVLHQSQDLLINARRLLVNTWMNKHLRQFFLAAKHSYLWASIFILWLLFLLLLSLGLATSWRISFILIIIRFLQLTHTEYVRLHKQAYQATLYVRQNQGVLIKCLGKVFG